MKNLSLLLPVFMFLALAGCSDDGNEGECDLANPDCAEGLVCEVVQGGKPHCVAPVIIRGQVLDASDDSPIEGALVQAVDANGAAVGTSDETGSDGRFALTVPATRDGDGNPLSMTYTLRCQAAGYQPFPTAIRPALPMDASGAQLSDGEWTIQSTLTTIKLLELPGDTSGLGSISGTILADMNAGILVVAENATAGYTGFSDAAGDYTIFNVPAGSYTVRGYVAGVQLTPADATLSAGDHLTDVDLTQADTPLNTVSGSVQMVNAPGDAVTSIVLAVESTFVESVSRGEVPPGLRVGDVNTNFVIENVPDGRYVSLAAFENDDLVQDPDQTIGGTEIVHLELPDPESGNSVTLPGFKVTEALAVVEPGAEGAEAIDTTTPTFKWIRDSGEEGYEVYLFDAFGDKIWEFTEIPKATGSEPVQYTYDGDPLEADMYYQFRAISYIVDAGRRVPISATEDLKGVFYYPSNP